MFKGITRSLLIINGLMLGLPAVMLLAIGGEEWLERLQLMSPIF